ARLLRRLCDPACRVGVAWGRGGLRRVLCIIHRSPLALVLGRLDRCGRAARAVLARARRRAARVLTALGWQRRRRVGGPGRATQLRPRLAGGVALRQGAGRGVVEALLPAVGPAALLPHGSRARWARAARRALVGAGRWRRAARRLRADRRAFLA